MSRKIRSIAAALAISVASAGFAASASAEMTLRAVGPWPKTHSLTKSFLSFIDIANKAAKGQFQIKYLGGSEVTKAREQPMAMRNGLFDMIFGPTGYYLGIFPEGDFNHGFKTAMAQRANGTYDMVRMAMKKKLNARYLARFDSGLGLYLFLKDKPKRTASGGIDLTGLKLRGSPTYRDFIKDLGGTAVIMRSGAVYTALERGVIDGMGFSLTDIRDRGMQKFIKYWIDPPFTYANISLIMSYPAWNKMPAGAQKLMDRLVTDYERSSYEKWVVKTKKEKVLLKKLGLTQILLEGKTGREYVETFMKGPWGRMAKNPKVILDVAKLKKLAY